MHDFGYVRIVSTHHLRSHMTFFSKQWGGGINVVSLSAYSHCSCICEREKGDQRFTENPLNPSIQPPPTLVHSTPPEVSRQL